MDNSSERGILYFEKVRRTEQDKKERNIKRKEKECNIDREGAEGRATVFKSEERQVGSNPRSRLDSPSGLTTESDLRNTRVSAMTLSPMDGREGIRIGHRALPIAHRRWIRCGIPGVLEARCRRDKPRHKRGGKHNRLT